MDETRVIGMRIHRARGRAPDSERTQESSAIEMSCELSKLGDGG